MIVSMKKIRILSRASRKEELIVSLRNLGVLHPVTREKSNESLEKLREKVAMVKGAIRAIPDSGGARASSGSISSGRAGKKTSAADAAAIPEARQNVSHNPAELAQHIIKKEETLRERESELHTLHKEIARIEEWGNFDPDLMRALSQNSGLHLSLAIVKADELTRIPADVSYIILSRKKHTCRLLLLGDPHTLNFDVLNLPEHSLRELLRREEKISMKYSKLQEEMAEFQAGKKMLRRYQYSLEKDIEFSAVQANMETCNELPTIVTIEGFIPVSHIEKFQSLASEQGIAFTIEDPDIDDTVPTLIRNPRAVCISEPIFTFMDTLPGYREHDISFWFLLFFSLFFAMIIGDAGYGALLSVVSAGAILSARIRRRPVSNVLILFMTLGVSTILWGAASGNWFGYAPIGDIPFFAQFIIPQLDAFAEGTLADTVVETLLVFCFSLGIVHLLLAHTLAFLKKLREDPRIHAFADVGWSSTLIGLYFFVLNLVVSAEKFPVPPVTLPLIFGGLIVVILFAGQEGDGFFRGVLRTLNIGNLIYTALTAISSFADIISYIRLFAVGLASVEIARSFNNMAEGIMQSGGAVGTILGIVVLCIGHSLNLVMGGLSVLVHGLRLKMLEFSGHLGNEWTGFAYKPFRN